MLPYLVFTLTGLASTALANGPIDILGLSPTVNEPEKNLEKRQDMECASSVLTEIMPALPTDPAFSSWAESAGSDRIAAPGCTVTVPASFSDEYLEYFTSLQEWFGTVEDEAATLTDCGIPSLALSLSALCSTSQTIYFEDEAMTTSGSMSSTVLEILEVPRETIYIGEDSGSGSGGDSGSDSDSDNGASEKRALLGLAVTLAGFLGAAAIL